MKKAHPLLRKQLELLNLAIGAVLIAISLVYFFNSELDYFASWFIFGCMYMVMDKYWPSDEYSTARVNMDIFKYVINVAALIVSLWFLTYII